MLELTGVASVLRGISLLYWLVAAATLALVLWKGGRWWSKTIGTLIVVAVFGYLPLMEWIEAGKREAFAREAWAYFKKKCDTEAGEKIYRPVPGVNSVLVIRALPPANDNDNFDQFWYGDPYSGSASENRGTYAATRLVSDWRHRRGVGVQRGLEFVEMKNESGDGYTRIYRPESNDKLSVKEQIRQPISKFGVSWEDISTPQDRKYWVAGSRFRVVDLADNSVIAERIGFLIERGFGSRAGHRSPWLTARGIGPNGSSCPAAYDPTDQWFVSSVFQRDRE